MNTQIYEEAAEWFVEFRSGDVGAGASERFDTWIRRSPEHLHAYLEISEIWQDSSGVGPGAGEMKRLIAAARADSNVIRVGEPPGPIALDLSVRASTAAPERHRISRRPLASAALLLIMILSGVWLYPRNIYSTGIGEQRTVRLEDGSTIDLNSRSKLRVRFSAHRRGVELLAGQALFHVARDTTRPFIVLADDAHLRAVGTQFDVYRNSTGTIVTVLEGHVAVLDSKAQRRAGENRSADDVISATTRGPDPDLNPGELLLSAGEQLTISSHATLLAQSADVASATAWTQHRMVFKSSPLPAVAEEFNRYNTKQVVIADTSLDSFRISGVYSSRDPATLIRFLREQPGIVVEDTVDSFRIARRP